MLNTPPKSSTLKARAVTPWESELPSFYRVHPCGSQNVTDALSETVHSSQNGYNSIGRKEKITWKSFKMKQKSWFRSG